MRKEIYFDAHATTPVHPDVMEAMAPFFCQHFGNANSDHQWGWKANSAVANAKKQIAELVGCKTTQVFTTSGATESIHWVLMGWARKHPQGKIITTTTEHKATYGAGEWAEQLGAQLVTVGVDSSGQVDMDQLENELKTDQAVLVSIIHGNNEIGTLNPIKKIAKTVKAHPSGFIHVDAAQSVGKVPVQFEEWDIDYLSFSGHKLYAPKGIGALIVKDSETISPLYLGGGQQKGMRAGTLNVPSIVGLGAACQWCNDHMIDENGRMAQLRDKMVHRLTSESQRVKMNGHLTERLPHNINLTFEGVSMDKLLLGLPGVAFSGSSACTSSTASPSHVLTAIGLTPAQTRSTVRFGLSYLTTEESVDEITDKILETLKKAENWLS